MHFFIKPMMILLGYESKAFVLESVCFFSK